MDIHQFLNNDYFLLTLTFGVYFLSKLVRKVLRLPVFNPILVSIAFMICFLTVADIDYDTYKMSGSKIDFWLKPAVVALGVPLYKQLHSIKHEMIPIFMSQLVGCLVGISPICRSVKGSSIVACGKIRHHPNSYGGDTKHWRHPIAHSHNCCLRRNIRSRNRFPHP